MTEDVNVKGTNTHLKSDFHVEESVGSLRM